MAKDKTELLAEINALFPDNTTGEISPEDIRTQQASMVESLALAEGALQVFAFAAYGGIKYGAAGVADFNDIGSGWQTIDIADQLSIDPPRGVTVDIGAASIAVNEPGVYQLSVGGSLNHNSSNSSRHTELRMYDIVDNVVVSQSLRVGIGRNAESTSFGVSIPFEVSAAQAGEGLVVQIGGGDILTSVEFNSFNFGVHGIGEYRGSIDI